MGLAGAAKGGAGAGWNVFYKRGAAISNPVGAAARGEVRAGSGPLKLP